ncbi:biotin--[acetyl-CoA-carboxylase] ligase [Microbacterium sp. MYb62]|uniref:biotin--[acetyl-CoA-carboxylase] ligase n=1 Tax=Microbacterium sp. MYb62 TaxID=1848690 RepID=UPI000CFD0835|nr:biotin--[acetyl-CoA-carboxylase] ligase [Microbacterium sp. MYb62]PRB15155.1 biotin--[acetyl-CoA-carboxylase] ligase [Microbacterium sp. MYb62]
MDFPRAQSVAPRLELLTRTGSTNADLRVKAEAVEEWPHLSTLVTRDQTAGRGRLDRTWVAPEGTALAISVLLRALPDDAAARCWIPLAAGVAMSEAVAAQLPGHDVAVKWPNDVLVDGGKICGILAEATSGAVVVGAGVNTAMASDQLPVPTATSFAVLGGEVDEDLLLASYLEALDGHLSALIAAGDAVASGLHHAVTASCATLGQTVRVSMPGDLVLEGSATAIDADGRLLVVAEGVEHAVSAGDVVHVRPAGT